MADGCYEFDLLDSGEDGLSFWANPAQGNGMCRLRKNTGPLIKSFNADFGGQIYYQFTIGWNNDIEDYILTDELVFYVYPNPTNGHVFIDVNFTERNDGVIEICDLLGKKIYSHSFTGLTAEAVDVDLSSYHSGTYFVTVSNSRSFCTKAERERSICVGRQCNSVCTLE